MNMDKIAKYLGIISGLGILALALYQASMLQNKMDATIIFMLAWLISMRLAKD